MCGLTGLLTIASVSADDLQSIVAVMTRKLSHRGPDAEGIWTAQGIALGHRRLSILDLSTAGAQPMHSACGRFVMAFNGEIYNHLDLRRRLETEGRAPNWRGQSDTETLLAGICAWSLDETLQAASGMFAIALWDKKERRLCLARDRMGEKPLYWGWAGNNLIFGSELKALRAHPQYSGRICRGALAQYLRFSYVPAPRSIHIGLYKLEPGTILEVSGRPPPNHPKDPLRPGERYGPISIRRYWHLNDVVEEGALQTIGEDRDAVELLGNTLDAAVSRQLISDVPLGAFLSGGIDSSTIVALMQKNSTRPIRTFTVGFDDPDFDESPYAEAVARHLGTQHQTLQVTSAETRDVIPELPSLYDEPFADSSQIPTYLVCRAARRKVTVALSGDGGDELFGGYNRYIHGPRLWERLSYIPKELRKTLGTAICMVPSKHWDMFGSVYNRFNPGAYGLAEFGVKTHRIGQCLRVVDGEETLHSNLTSVWFDPNLLLGETGTEPPLPYDEGMPKRGLEHPASRMMFQDMRTYLPDDILCKVDRAAMGVSLETRAPFLDPTVIELSSRLPLHMKIRDGKGKWALRQVLYQFVPRELVERPKVGFGIPIGEWLRGPLRSWAGHLLSSAAFRRGDLIKPQPVMTAWAEHLSRKNDWTQQLWTVLMLLAWQESLDQS